MIFVDCSALECSGCSDKRRCNNAEFRQHRSNHNSINSNKRIFFEPNLIHREREQCRKIVFHRISHSEVLQIDPAVNHMKRNNTEVFKYGIKGRKTMITPNSGGLLHG